jgi:HEAT repeat protein
LGLIGDPKAVDPLIKALSDEGFSVRMSVISGLGKMGPPAKPAVSHLCKLLEHKSYRIRGNAAGALKGIGPNAKEAQGPLLDCFRRCPPNDDELSWWCLGALWTIGPDKTIVTPILEHAPDFESVMVPVYAAVALAKVGKPAVPALREALKSPNAKRRRIATSALRYMGREIPETLDLLTQVLKTEKEPDARAEAAYGLATFGPAAKDAVPQLIALLIESDPSDNPRTNDRRRGAAVALAAIGPDARDAIKALEKSWAKERKFNGEEAEAMAYALVRIGAGSKDRAFQHLVDTSSRFLVDIGAVAVEPLLAKLKKDDSTATVRLLGEFGPAAEAAIPALKGRLEHKRPEMRRAAREALKRIALPEKKHTP